jgi:hypothetical protein
MPTPRVTTVGRATPTAYPCSIVRKDVSDANIGYQAGAGWYITHRHTRITTPVSNLGDVQEAIDALLNPQWFTQLPARALTIYCDASRHISLAG